MTDERLRLDPRTLRGLAHPLRVRLLDLLRNDGRSTATRLAERLGQSSGATSYHLRQLAEYGFVEEDPQQGDGRERWWRAKHRGTVLDEESGITPAEAEGYLRSIAGAYAQRVGRFLDEVATIDDGWASSWTLSARRLQLTADEARALNEELHALMARYRRAEPGVAGPEGSLPVDVQFLILPETS